MPSLKSRRLYKHKHPSRQIVAALNSHSTVSEASRSVGMAPMTPVNRARLDPEIAAALSACQERAKLFRISPRRRARLSGKYQCKKVAAAINSASSRRAAADALGVTLQELSVFIGMAPKTLRPLYKACIAREPRLFSRKFPREVVLTALRGAPSLNAAVASLGWSVVGLSKRLSERPDPEIIQAKDEVVARGRALRQALRAATRQSTRRCSDEEIAAALSANSPESAALSLGLSFTLMKAYASSSDALQACLSESRRRQRMASRNSAPDDESIVRALHNSNSVTEAAAQLDVSYDKLIYRGQQAREVLAALGACSERRSPTAKALIGKFARLRRRLATGGGRGYEFQRGDRFKIVDHTRFGFSVVHVDDNGREVVAKNSFGRFFITGVTRLALEIEDEQHA